MVENAPWPTMRPRVYPEMTLPSASSSTSGMAEGQAKALRKEAAGEDGNVPSLTEYDRLVLSASKPEKGGH